MRLSLALGLFLGLSLPLLAQPVASPQLFIEFSGLSTDERYDRLGDVVAFDDRLEEGVSAYAMREIAVGFRHPLVDGLSASVTVPLRYTSITPWDEPDGSSLSSFDLGDAAVGLALDVTEPTGLGRDWLVFAELTITVPLGYRRNVTPLSGAGQIDAALDVSIERAFLDDDLRAGATVGFRTRTRVFAFSRVVPCEPGVFGDDARCFSEHARPAYSDEVLAGARVSYVPLDWLRATLLSRVAWSVRAPEAVARTAGVYDPARFEERRYVEVGGRVAATLFGQSALVLGMDWPVVGYNVVRAPVLRGTLAIGL